MHATQGSFLAHGANNQAIVLRWTAIPGKSAKLNETIKSLAPILVPAYTTTEVAFARQHPEAIAEDFMLKSLAPLVRDNIHAIDWHQFEEQTAAVLKQFFITTNWAQYAQEHDSHIFVNATDQQTGALLGTIQFVISPESSNNVHAGLSGVISSAHNRGLLKVLMSTILKIHPTERISLDTRSTNQQAIETYEHWGFTRIASTRPHWTNLEYHVNDTPTPLQRTAESLIKQSE